MGADVTRDKGRAIVTFSGECTVEQAADLRTAVLDALDGVKKISFELSGIERADLSLLQILCASHMEAQERSVVFECGSKSSALADAVRKSGFQRTASCTFDAEGACAFKLDDEETDA